LIRNSHTDWDFEEVVFRDGPYLPINDVDNKVSASGEFGLGDTKTLSFENEDGINGDDGFSSSDIGRFLRIRVSDGWSWWQITDVNSSDSVDAKVLRVGTFEFDEAETITLNGT